MTRSLLLTTLANRSKSVSPNANRKSVTVTEVWADVVGFEGVYQVSSTGQLRLLEQLTITRDGKRRRRRGMVIKPQVGPFGHRTAHLQGGGKTRITGVHRLVLEAFVGPCPDGMECRHLDGNPANNDVSNLCWGTHTDNMRDRIKHGTTNHGTRCHLTHSHFSDEVVESLLRMWEGGGYKVKQLAKMFRVSYDTVWLIVNGHTWKHIKRKT